jgi:hypothetical protein
MIIKSWLTFAASKKSLELADMALGNAIPTRENGWDLEVAEVTASQVQKMRLKLK